MGVLRHGWRCRTSTERPLSRTGVMEAVSFRLAAKNQMFLMFDSFSSREDRRGLAGAGGADR